MLDALIIALADYTIMDIALRVSFGAVIGLCLGLTGVGGGLLIIPVLRGVFAMSPVMAVGTASLCAALMKMNAGVMHIRNGNIDWKSIALVLCGAAPTLLVTSVGIVTLSENPATSATINQMIEYLIMAVIVFAMIAMTRHSKPVIEDASKKKESFFKPKVVLAGAATGIVMGATGVGGGVLLLPLLSTTLGLDMKKSIGSSVVIALALSLAAALMYREGGQTDTITAVLLVAGSLVGIPVAGWLMKALSDRRLQQISLGLIAVSAVVMLRSVFTS